MKPRLRFTRGYWRCGEPDREMSLWWTWGETPWLAYERWVMSRSIVLSTP
jgi:hypothetical protein